MPDSNPIEPILDDFTRRWNKLAVPIVNAINKRIAEGHSINSSVDFVFYKYGVKKQFRNLVLSIALDSARKSGIELTSGLMFKKWYLNKHWPGDDLTLSQKINRLEFKKIIVNTINQNFRQGKNLMQLAKSLTDKDLTKADIPKYINNVIKQARRISATNTDLREFRSSMNKAGRQIENLAQAGAPTQRLKKAYQNLIDKAQTFNEQQLDKAVDRAVRAKARYNAERIARTEGAKAFGAGRINDARENDDVVALQWSLSDNHNVFDICDFNASADLYGLGKGIYPKDNFPTYPAHPHCLCNIDEVYGEEIEEGKFNPKAGEKYLKNLSAHKQTQLLGIDGRKNLKDWEDNLRNFDDTQVPDIPDRLIN